MFEAEARWLGRLLGEMPTGALSPVLNIGSSTRHFREVEQPWAERELFAPLRAREVQIVHLDAREGDGIDIRADVLSDADLPRIKAIGARTVLCCNILEHVRDPAALAKRCTEFVAPGGFVFVTVPHSYPHHRDPIDTMFRPSPSELATLFRPARLIRGEVLDVGESYRDQVAKRPWILLRHILRFPFPFIHFAGWKRSMRKTYWLVHNYEITGAIFQTPESAEIERKGVLVDSAGRGP